MRWLTSVQLGKVPSPQANFERVLFSQQTAIA